MRLLVLGVTGMLGSAMFRTLAGDQAVHEVFGTVRSSLLLNPIGSEVSGHILDGVDVENNDSLIRVFAEVHPDVVINCIGLVKQLSSANNSLAAIPINTLLPHRLASLCAVAGARLIHISTDCVFSGAKGNYVESDFPDAEDLYGRSKLLGEVDYPHAVTLRTSIIGHELSGQRSLIGWFLAQQGSVQGFTRAIFSGLPTIELARVVRDFVLPQPELRGLYHVSAQPIDKFQLLTLVSQIYGKEIDLVPENEFIIDRSLNSDRFRAATTYTAPPWQELIERMCAAQKSS